jgi:glyoxylase-like metal-dependent hydrolase (beta-lactamase superfamily II)
VSVLSYRVYVTGQIPQTGRGPLPDGSTRQWSPISCTLVAAAHDAVLIDAPFTTSQALAVIDWVRSSNKRLTAVYITHGHGDHWFGVLPLLDAFPDVSVLATPGTIAHMRSQGSPEFRASFWDAVFPGQLPTGEVDVREVGADGFELEGHRLQPVELGHTDTDDTTALHVPDADLVVAGDAVYNGVHPYLTESGDGGIDAWLAALDIVEALDTKHVVAGHKDPTASDDRSHIGATRRYLRDAQRLLAADLNSMQFYEAMLQMHGDRINPGALWGAAITLLPSEGN